MSDLAFATGRKLLYADGVLPPNPSRQALAFASPAQANKLDSDGYAAQDIATVLGMETDQPAGGTQPSPTAMQLLVNALNTPDNASSSPAATGGSSGLGGGHLAFSAASVSSFSDSAAPAGEAAPATAGPAINVLA